MKSTHASSTRTGALCQLQSFSPFKSHYPGPASGEIHHCERISRPKQQTNQENGVRWRWRCSKRSRYTPDWDLSSWTSVRNLNWWW
jgi:hypothetical protein